MDPKFYFTSLASRPMTLSGHVIKFVVCSVSGGRAVGVYEATNPGEIAALDAAVQGKRGVREIGADEFESLKKKVMPTPTSGSSDVSRPRVVRIPMLPQEAIEARPGVPSAGLRRDGSQNPPEELPPSPSIGSLLRVKRVNPPKPFAGAEEKTKASAARADRAKVRMVRPPVSTG